MRPVVPGIACRGAPSRRYCAPRPACNAMQACIAPPANACQPKPIGAGQWPSGIRFAHLAGSLPMPRTVLIVDDERDTNEILASLVQARDFEPIQLFSGERVPDAVREHQPDLILLDLMLPDVDGFAICERLKRNRETNLIPVIMVTALNDANHRALGRPRRGQRLPDQAVHPRAALRRHRQGPGLARRALRPRHHRRDQLRHPQRADLPASRPTTCSPTSTPTPR